MVLGIETGTPLDNISIFQLLIFYLQLRCLFDLVYNIWRFRPHYRVDLNWAQTKLIAHLGIGPCPDAHLWQADLDINLIENRFCMVFTTGGSYMADLAFVLLSFLSVPVGILVALILACGKNIHTVDLGPHIVSWKVTLNSGIQRLPAMVSRLMAQTISSVRTPHE